MSTVGVEGTGCAKSQTWTATYTDGCGNEAVPVSVTYTWTEDTELPVIATTAVSGDLGCNPTVVAPAFTGSDNCEGDISAAITVHTIGVEGTGCAKSQTWTATYTDGCGNEAVPVSVTYTWTETETPSISTTLVNSDKGCEWDHSDAPTTDDFTVTGSCETAPTVTLTTGAVTEEGCMRSQTWTATYTNVCGQEAAPIDVTYTWGMPNYGTDEQFACGSFELNGVTYTESQVITYTIPNANACGCDSIVTLTLTIDELSVSVTSHSDEVCGDDGSVTVAATDGLAPIE